MPEDYYCGSLVMKIESHAAPDDWPRFLEASLAWFIKQGALVSWCGHELCSQWLEAIGPDGGAGLVYAGYSKQTGMLCRSGLEDQVLFLDDAESLLLWQVIEADGHDIKSPGGQ